jgi:hypothetical protein
MQGWSYIKVQYKSLESVTDPKSECKVDTHMRLFFSEIKVIWKRKGVGRKKGTRKEVKKERKIQQ